MDFRVRVSPESVEVLLTGRLEFTDHDSLPDIVQLLDDPGGPRMVLDMSGLDFIDSAGLGMLLILQDEAEQRNIKLIVQGAHGDVQRSIELARLNEIISIAS
jgi:Anti-anti-sigma regulatory factor (antagonist of anti-sigma factor)